MRHNAKKVGDVWRLDPPEGIKQYLCQCDKIGMPAVSPYNILEISEEQVSEAKILPNRFSIIKILERKLKDNGSFFMFHNDMEMISELMVNIKKQTKFIFKQMIVWNKRFNGSSKKGFMDGSPNPNFVFTV